MDDLEGFESMFRREHPRLVALGLALTGDRETARELAQDALAKAYLAWSTVGSYERPGAWLRRVVVNQAIDVHRRRSSERDAWQRVGPGQPVEPEASEPASSAWWRAVRDLPERQRTAVALHYVDEYSIAEIADVMNIRPGTVKATLSHARRSLAAALGTYREAT